VVIMKKVAVIIKEPYQQYEFTLNQPVVYKDASWADRPSRVHNLNIGDLLRVDPGSGITEVRHAVQY